MSKTKILVITALAVVTVVSGGGCLALNQGNYQGKQTNEPVLVSEAQPDVNSASQVDSASAKNYPGELTVKNNGWVKFFSGEFGFSFLVPPGSSIEQTTSKGINVDVVTFSIHWADLFEGDDFNRGDFLISVPVYKNNKITQYTTPMENFGGINYYLDDPEYAFTQDIEFLGKTYQARGMDSIGKWSQDGTFVYMIFQTADGKKIEYFSDMDTPPVKQIFQQILDSYKEYK